MVASMRRNCCTALGDKISMFNYLEIIISGTNYIHHALGRKPKLLLEYSFTLRLIVFNTISNIYSDGSSN